ncbi:MAG: hypothetical protein IK008_00050 [Bacteroidales bacterium]|nr:hypothetical protein [Bacteroidales bacterium]
MEENPNNAPQKEEEGIDIFALLKNLWAGRKTIIIWTVVFMALGLLSALTMKRTYTVTSVMVPQLGSSRNSSLLSLAGMAGFDLGTSQMNGQELSPLVYPQILRSTTFCLELANTPLHYAEADSAISMFTYAREYNKPTVLGTVRKYTIGLPGTLIGLLKREKPVEEAVADSTLSEALFPLQPVKLTSEEAAMVKAVSSCISMSVDKKEGYLVLTVTGIQPLQTAELAVKTQQLLQAEITRFRTEKAQKQLEYVQARYNEIKAETEAVQASLAVATDRSQSMTTARAHIERDRLQNKYAVLSSIYAEMAKQLEQAKMQVKRETPAMAIVQPITVPRQPSNSRIKTLIIWTFFGILLGCGIVLGRGSIPKLKAKFASDKERVEEENTDDIS